MKKWRVDRQLSYKQVSELCGVRQVLIAMVENGEVTHPIIVEKLKKLYSLTDAEAEELLPKNRRPNDPEYEPDKYVVPVNRGSDRIMPKQSLIERYMTEHLGEQAKLHAKRSNY